MSNKCGAAGRAGKIPEIELCRAPFKRHRDRILRIEVIHFIAVIDAESLGAAVRKRDRIIDRRVNGAVFDRLEKAFGIRKRGRVFTLNQVRIFIRAEIDRE